MRKRRKLLTIATTTLTLTALIPAVSANASGPDFTPGAPGIGDPYFPLEGNGGYDVEHYDVAFSYNPATHRIDGTTTVTARATQNLSRFDLDLQQLEVSKVTVGSRDATFTRDGQELQITPHRGIVKGSHFKVAVTYGGVPATIVGSPIVFGSPYGFVHTDDGAFMGDEPNGASTWIPTNDHPLDKATYTFHVTAPKDKQVIANGRLVSQVTQGDNATWTWAEKYPMASYLATADIGTWQFQTGRTPAGVKEVVGVDPKLTGRSPNIPDPMKFFWDTTAEATDLWSKTFGQYAFDETGAIADLATYDANDGRGPRTIGFSLETQTRPLYSDVRNTATIAHELAHQWFGDAVSVEHWNDIWLNESFATFAQWLWNEKHGGLTVHDQARAIYNRHSATDTWWNVVITNPQRDTMFHDRVYSGGGMVLQLLREKVGDQAFFALLNKWYETHKYANGNTAQFEALANQVTGQDLSGFFQTWSHSTGKPALP
jgi:aminopeptidase N